MTGENGWRRIFAILANPETRVVTARLMLGGTLDEATVGLTAPKKKRIVRALETAGLVDRDGRLLEAVFRDELAATAVVRRAGIERFVDGVRIQQFPSNLEERERLLRWVAHQAFTAGEVLAELEVNERLLPFSDDTALLRRYLVDFGIMERRPDGAAYALTATIER